MRYLDTPAGTSVLEIQVARYGLNRVVLVSDRL